MTWFRVGGAGIPAALKNAMNAVFNKKFGTSGQNYPPKQWPDDVNLMGPLPEGTASGQIANFTDGADDVPIKNCIVTLPGSLEGYTEVNGLQTGKNLLKDSIRYKTGGNIFFGGATSNTEVSLVLPAGTYTMTLKNAVNQNVNLYLKDLDADAYVSGFPSYNSASTDPKSKTFTLSQKTRLCAWAYSPSYTATSDIDFCQIEVGSMATAYKPFETPTQYAATLGRLIYGGSADLVNGVGQENYDKYTITGQETGYYLPGENNNGNRIGFPISAQAQTPLYTGGLSNIGENKACLNSSTWTVGSWCIYSSRLYIVVPNEYTTFETALQYLFDNNVTFVFPLSTPTDFTFDGQEINSLYGVNNFWNDAGGDTTVVYRRDIDLALQAVSSSRGLMMASRQVTQLIGEESDPDQVNELVENDEDVLPEQLSEFVENDETEQEGENDAR